jgi:hypothetical protein
VCKTIQPSRAAEDEQRGTKQKRRVHGLELIGIKNAEFLLVPLDFSRLLATRDPAALESGSAGEKYQTKLLNTHGSFDVLSIVTVLTKLRV